MPAILTYKVGVTRAVRGGPVRWITVQLAEPVGEIRQASLFFYDKAPSSLGCLNHKTGFAMVNFLASDFDATYRILNTEKPVFIHWRTDPEEDQLVGFDLSTSEEPLGEGTPDKSP